MTLPFFFVRGPMAGPGRANVSPPTTSLQKGQWQSEQPRIDGPRNAWYELTVTFIILFSTPRMLDEGSPDVQHIKIGRTHNCDFVI